MIVGADAASDQTILETSANLYGSYKLKRVYYSAFSPIPDSSRSLPLQAPPLVREHRLYQADWLMRFYGFDIDEITDPLEGGMLPLDIDPKLAWALRHRDRFPLDGNRASRKTCSAFQALASKPWIAHHGPASRISALQILRDCMYRGTKPSPLSFSPITSLLQTTRRQSSHRTVSSACHPTEFCVLMHVIALATETDFEGWRDAARALALNDISPNDVTWTVASRDDGLFAASTLPELDPRHSFSVPAAFVELAHVAILNRDPERFALLYRLLIHLRQQPHLMDISTDSDVVRVQGLAKEVRRDEHKMHAFVRFREFGRDDDFRFVAWFEPSHYIVELAAPFFERRFADMAWSILTPDRCAHWNGHKTVFTEGAVKSAAPSSDPLEDIWRTYYANIFNPARLKIKAMQTEMPKKYWRNLPEASLIEPLIAKAGRITQTMIDREAPAPRPSRQRKEEPAMQVPRPSSPKGLRFARGGRRLPRLSLVEGRNANRVRRRTFHAPIMLVGEQPGDKDLPASRQGPRPGAQPGAGRSRIDRDKVYVTNAVTNSCRAENPFAPKPSTRRSRLAANGMSANCCDQARLVVAMGATAAQSVLGKITPIGKNRGHLIDLMKRKPR